MKLALLFAGQGAQKVGMGRDLYDGCAAFRDTLDQVQDVLDFDLKALMWEGLEEQLSQTQYTQPAMVAFAAGVVAVLREAGVLPAAAAGLSLGEYSALLAAGVLDPVTAVELVACRGRAMAQAVAGRPSAMAAVLGLDRAALQGACARAAQGQVVEIANYNCPGQMVVGGDRDAVDRACALAKEAGAKRCLPLKVSGPFHTSLMAPAGEALGRKLETVPLGEMAYPVYFNCLGGPMGPGDTVPALLRKQVQSSVYLEDTLVRMAADGIDTILEIGPGRVLSGFVKKTVPQLADRTRGVETAQELAEALTWLKEEV